ncbi:MAG: hypothetical protein A3K06_00240 [Candidatus Doudnabacteria bacterium RIFCSPHIGHO2_01_52_17]|uniref:Uncharacterized protein n=1 Tax=Candidatus Doudnabacteria bacterium RIFCSPHIGHO2_01_52_17 TaxID=1817820 RepID=A0A1F5NEX3_9BACT|nr:MAG: hypothetical protein A3K06_00240 [Candidatus Doudnabacteria bacterium RIFCSPHIGHO2_01_52_17]
MEDKENKQEGPEKGVWIAARQLNVGEKGAIESDTSVKILSEESQLDGKISSGQHAQPKIKWWRKAEIIVAIAIGLFGAIIAIVVALLSN